MCRTQHKKWIYRLVALDDGWWYAEFCIDLGKKDGTAFDRKYICKNIERYMLLFMNSEEVSLKRR